MDNEILKEILNEVKTMKTDLAELKTDVSELKTDVVEIKTDVAELKTDVSELKTDVAELKTDVSELKTDVAVLKTDVIVLKDTQQGIIKKLDAVYDETANLMEFRIDTTGKLKDITEKMNIMEDVTKQNLYDIAKLKYARWA